MRRTKQALRILFAVYLVFLVWAILFKLSFSLRLLDHRRAFNLIPFYDNGSVDYRFVLREMWDNVLLFLPYGLYLYLLGCRRLGTGLLLFLGTSLCFELLQFAFALGVGDITDLITNTLGGALGWTAARLLVTGTGRERQMTRALTVLAAAATALMAALAAAVQFW